VVQRLYAEHAFGKQVEHLLAHQGDWMSWCTTCWARIDEAELKQAIYGVLAQKWYWHETAKTITPKPWHPTKAKLGNALDALRAAVHLPTGVDAPTWIEPPPGIEPPAWTGYGANMTDAAATISVANGLLDVSTRTLAEHTPSFYNLVSVPFDHDPAAPKPVAWLKFLKSVWPDDPEAIRLLAQWFGYVLSGRLDQQKLLLMHGPTRSGKGTIATVITDLLGGGHVANPTMASLSTNFGLWPLIGRPLAIIPDARLGKTSTSSPVVERILSITGEDRLTIDRKYSSHWTGKLPTRLMLLSNELPQFRDASGVIANRFMVIKMTRSWAKNPDRGLAARLRPELPGILNWALDGLDDLNASGTFIVPKSSQEELTLIQDMASPVSAFIRERCIRAPGAWCGREELYQAYRLWCEDAGYRPVSKIEFGRDLRAVAPELRRSQRTVKGKRVDGVLGIKPKTA
jgi:putative DNA primase/helicase